jgi:hypothetical protein
VTNFPTNRSGTDITVEIHRLVDRRQDRWQRSQTGIFDQMGRFGGYVAERAFGFLIGNLAAPGQRLAIQILEAAEVACGLKVAFDIRDWSLDPTLSIGMSQLNRERRKKNRVFGEKYG